MSGQLRKVDHIGIAVVDLDEAIQLYTMLFGIGPFSVEDVPEQKVRTAFFRAGETNIELLYPLSQDSPVSRFLEKRGSGIHHICFEVVNIEESLERYAAEGVRLIDEKPRPGAHNKKIAFMHPKSTGGVLLELSESTLACSRRPHTPHSNADPEA